jgi:hypothetical protein
MRAIEKLSRWWLVANVDSAELLRGRLIVVALSLANDTRHPAGSSLTGRRAVAREGESG